MTAARSRHAALSGSHAKAPGFAGGYLLADQGYAGAQSNLGALVRGC